MDKIGEFYAVSNAAKFNEINEQIKRSMGLMTKAANSFEYSEPIPVDTQTDNSDPNDISKFVFREPLQRLKTEETDPTEELVERLSLVNIENNDESINQSDCSLLLSSDEVFLNHGNDYIETSSNHVDSTIKEEFEDYVASFVVNNNIETSSIHLDAFVKEEFDVTSTHHNGMIQSSNDNDANDNIETLSLPPDGGTVSDLQSDFVQASSFQTNCSNEPNVENIEASTDANDNSQTSSLQPDSSMDLDDRNVVASKDFNQSCGFLIEKKVENNEGTTDVNDNIPTSSVLLHGSMEQDARCTAVSSRQYASSFQTDCSKEQNVENNEVTTDANDNSQTSSHEPDSSMDLDVRNVVASNDSNRLCDFQAEENVENDEASADGNDNNIQPTVDIDPNTQITNLDVDSNKKDPPSQIQYNSQPLPFLIKHIHTITWPNQDEVCFAPVIKLFGQTCSTVMVYGVVTSLTVGNGGLLQRFVIDDGSAAITVVWKASRRIIEHVQAVHHLGAEVKQCRQSGLSVMNENWQPNSKECTEMLNSLDHIMHYIKRESTGRTKLKLFGHAAVVGTPVRPPGKGIVQLHSTMVQDDSGEDRSLELYFKKNLIRLYEEKYMGCSNRLCDTPIN